MMMIPMITTLPKCDTPLTHNDEHYLGIVLISSVVWLMLIGICMILDNKFDHNVPFLMIAAVLLPILLFGIYLL